MCYFPYIHTGSFIYQSLFDFSSFPPNEKQQQQQQTRAATTKWKVTGTKLLPVMFIPSSISYKKDGRLLITSHFLNSFLTCTHADMEPSHAADIELNNYIIKIYWQIMKLVLGNFDNDLQGIGQLKREQNF